MGKCPYCTHGKRYAENSSSYGFTCPDCGGTGYLPECDVCGQEYTNEYCKECYAECLDCGEVCAKENMVHGMCSDCYELMCKHCHGTGYLKSHCDIPDPICHFCKGTGRKD